MNLFETLETKKKNGETLDFYKLSREELKQLWYEEGVTDYYIAKLFDITPHTVNKRRREFKLMWDDCIWEDCCKQTEFQQLLKQYIENNATPT